MTNQENSLKVIRYIQDTVEGLKELSFGCKIKYNGSENMLLGKVVNRTPIHKESEYRYQLMDNERWGAENLFSVYGDQINDFEIIGHEPQLNHLLLAIKNNGGLLGIELYGEEFGLRLDTPYGETIYDLTKTVEENLESNPELTNYLINLFGL